MVKLFFASTVIVFIPILHQAIEAVQHISKVVN